MENEFVEYITKDGDRWDTIADEYLGSPFEAGRIYRANPNVRGEPALLGGIRLLIPVVSLNEVVASSTPVPFWKQ